MAFTRSFEQSKIDKMHSDKNVALFNKLKGDVLKGEVFPAVRINELHFYYKGGCLYKFVGGRFNRNKNYEKYGVGLEEPDEYERAKKENEIKYKNLAGAEGERQLLDSLYSHTFSRGERPSVVVLDIEVNLGGQAVRKCDLVLLNTLTDEIMFVEGKVFSDKRVNVAISFTPEVIEQVNIYTAAIASQRQNILVQYARHVEIVNKLFGTYYRPPKAIVEPAKLLCYGTPKSLNKNGTYGTKLIEEALGAGNVLWVKKDERPSLESIWDSLKGEQ